MTKNNVKVDDQWDGEFKLPFSGEPHRNMLAAILGRAILDLEDSDHVVRRDAIKWFLKPQSELKPKPFTFQWVCLHLDLEPQTLLLAISRPLLDARQSPQNVSRPRSLESTLHPDTRTKKFLPRHRVCA